MKKVAVLTDFFDPDFAYSLVSVASNQIKMLLRAGYSPRVLVDDHFPDPEKQPERVPYPWNSVELFRLPSIPRSNFVELHEGWQSDLEKMTVAMREGLKDIDVVMTHDVIYQPAQLLYQLAARRIAEERNGSLWFLNLTHSATTPALISTTNEYLQAAKQKFPFSYLCYPNEASKPRLARNFGYEEDEIKFTPHATDFCEFMGFQDITKKLVDEKDMLSADVIMVYPARLDRGKQLQFNILTMAELKKLGRSVRFIAQDFHSSSTDEKDDKRRYREELKKLAAENGLGETEVTFTSEFDESLRVRCPRQMVRDLMLLANVFILPSVSETYSLVAQESALCSNFLILNFDFSPLRSLYGEEACYFKFSSNLDNMTGFDGETKTSYSPSVNAYCRDIALRIIYELENNRVLKLKTRLRKTRSLDYVFRRYWEPLFYAQSG